MVGASSSVLDLQAQPKSPQVRDEDSGQAHLCTGEDTEESVERQKPR